MSVAVLDIVVNDASILRGSRNLQQFGRTAQDTERTVSGMAADVTAAMNRMNGSLENSKRHTDNASVSMRRLGGGGIQNVSWQLTDLTTQLQNGTSASVAFGQQIPQLLAGFGAWGAALGAVTAIALPALAFALGMGQDSIKALENDMKSFIETVKAQEDAMTTLSMSAKELQEKFGAAGEAIRTAAAFANELTLDKANQSFEELSGWFETFRDTSYFQMAADGVTEITTGAAQLAGALDSTLTPGIQRAQESMVAFNAATTLPERLRALEQVAAELANARDETGNVTAEMISYRESVNEAVASLAALVGSVQSATGETAALAANMATAAANAERAAAGLREFRRLEQKGLDDRRSMVYDYNFAGQTKLDSDTKTREEARKNDLAGWREYYGSRIAGQEQYARDVAQRKLDAFGEYIGDAIDRSTNPKDIKPAGGGGGGKSQSDKDLDALEREQSRRDELIDSLALELSLVGETTAARRIATETRRAGEHATEDEKNQIRALVLQIEEQERAQQQLDDTRQFVSDGLTDMFDTVIIKSGDAQESIASLAAQLSKMAANKFFINLLAGGFGGSPIGRFIQNTFIPDVPARANGGPVRRGMSYLVGEKRAELFTPSEDGYIHPNANGNGSGGGRIEVVSYFDDNGNFDAKVSSIAHNQAMRIVSLDRSARRRELPSQLQRITADPRRH